MTTPSNEQLHQLVNGTFVGPVPPPSGQLQVTVIPIDWNAYDVPRLWDAIRREADELAWLQVKGFENLGQLLLSQHDCLRRLREALAQSWDPQINQSAVNFFNFLDGLIQKVAEDAVAHASTSRSLGRIVMALDSGKQQIGQLKQQWDNVTTDWFPEWWDGKADDLNTRARQVIATVDRAVGDHRRQITVPPPYVYPQAVSNMQPVDDDQRRDDDDRGGHGGRPPGGSQSADSPPPPVPGYDPVPVRSAELQGLPGVPQYVPPVQGSPISLLPVPPGNPFAPGGGAYVLPGPGIGRGGFIYPMPTPPGVSGPGAVAGGRGGGGSVAGAAGMMPTPMPTSGSHGTAKRSGPGHGHLIWEVAKGVPPVIGEAEQIAEQTEREQEVLEEAFVDWFGDLATPWTKDVKVELRRTPESDS